MSKVLVNFIQDRSGSMANVWDETVSGFEIFLKQLKEGQEKDGIDYLFSLTCFDTQIDTPIVAQKLDIDAFVKTFKKHGPRGSTALYDAAGKTIKAVEDNRHGAEKIIVVICTDGQENSSREWSKEALHASIDAKCNAGDWTFTYLGTQPETWDDATTLGVGAGATSTYVGAAAGAAYTVTSTAINSFAASPHRATRNLLNDFTTRSVRASASMKTAQDDADDNSCPAGVGSFKTPPIATPPPVATKPPTGRPRTPAVPPRKKDSRRWK